MKKLITVLVRFLCILIGFFPRRWIRGLGYLFGFLWFDLLRIRQRVILDNLDRAFPKMSSVEKLKIGRKSVYAMGANFSEFFMIPSLNQKWLENSVVFEGLEYVEEALKMEKGLFLLSMHIGNGDMAATAISMKGIPITLITKTFKNKLMNDLWFSIRGHQGVKYIDAHGKNNAFEILKALKQNRSVVFVLDQFMGKPFGIATTFFGIKTGTAYGLALFYLKTKSPIIPIYTYEGNDQKMHVVFCPVLKLDHLIDDDKDHSILRLTQYFNDIIEEKVRKHPDQWMWVHRRWKEFE